MERNRKRKDMNSSDRQQKRKVKKFSKDEKKVATYRVKSKKDLSQKDKTTKKKDSSKSLNSGSVSSKTETDSAQPKTLPGYYYDPKLNRYFKMDENYRRRLRQAEEEEKERKKSTLVDQISLP